MINLLQELNKFYPVTNKNLGEFKNTFLYYKCNSDQINRSFNYFLSKA